MKDTWEDMERRAKSHTWRLHVPKHSGEGVITSKRYCEKCDGEITLLEDRNDRLLGAVLKLDGEEEIWVREKNRDMRQVDQEEYLLWFQERARRNGAKPLPVMWAMRDEDQGPSWRLRAVPKEETPEYPRMLEMHDWERRDCVRCGAMRRPILDQEGDLQGMAIMLPDQWEYHYIPGKGELVPASMEEFAKITQMDYAKEPARQETIQKRT